MKYNKTKTMGLMMASFLLGAFLAREGSRRITEKENSVPSSVEKEMQAKDEVLKLANKEGGPIVRAKIDLAPLIGYAYLENDSLVVDYNVDSTVSLYPSLHEKYNTGLTLEEFSAFVFATGYDTISMGTYFEAQRISGGNYLVATRALNEEKDFLYTGVTYDYYLPSDLAEVKKGDRIYGEGIVSNERCQELLMEQLEWLVPSNQKEKQKVKQK